MLVAEIKERVAHHFNLSLEELESRSMLERIVRPRQYAMILAVELTPHSKSRVAHFFRRDHTTLIHAEREIARLVDRNPKVRRELEEARALFPQEAAEQ
jgi:chromosomal replication initiator protein